MRVLAAGASMENFFLQLLRLSYAQAVLPLFRTMLVGSVLVMLALLAGFAAPRPATLARPVAPARGPLIEAVEHPEWKQFLVQAAYRRFDELERLEDLPNTPTIVPELVIERHSNRAAQSEPAADEAPTSTTEPQQVAALSAMLADSPPADPTGSIEASSSDLPIDIGEASATELPITIQDLPLPVRRPQSLKRFNESRHIQKPVKPGRTKAQRPAPAQTQQPDFFSSLFGGNSQASSSPSH